MMFCCLPCVCIPPRLHKSSHAGLKLGQSAPFARKTLTFDFDSDTALFSSDSFTNYDLPVTDKRELLIILFYTGIITHLLALTTEHSVVLCVILSDSCVLNL